MILTIGFLTINTQQHIAWLETRITQKAGGLKTHHFQKIVVIKTNPTDPSAPCTGRQVKLMLFLAAQYLDRHSFPFAVEHGINNILPGFNRLIIHIRDPITRPRTNAELLGLFAHITHHRLIDGFGNSNEPNKHCDQNRKNDVHQRPRKCHQNFGQRRYRRQLFRRFRRLTLAIF